MRLQQTIHSRAIRIIISFLFLAFFVCLFYDYFVDNPHFNVAAVLMFLFFAFSFGFFLSQAIKNTPFKRVVSTEGGLYRFFCNKRPLFILLTALRHFFIIVLILVVSFWITKVLDFSFESLLAWSIIGVIYASLNTYIDLKAYGSVDPNAQSLDDEDCE